MQRKQQQVIGRVSSVPFLFLFTFCLHFNLVSSIIPLVPNAVELERQLKWLNVIGYIVISLNLKRDQKMPLVISNTPYQNILNWLWNDSWTKHLLMTIQLWKSTQRSTDGTPHPVKMNSLYQICSKMLHGTKVINYIL